MGLFDSLRHAFNPEVKATYDMLYQKYYKGLKSYCSGGKVNIGGYTIDTHINISNPSYSDMKRIYDAKDAIISLHESILASEKMEADFRELEELRRKYPHAFISICAECLGGIIYDSSIKMPGFSHDRSSSSSIFIHSIGKYYNGQYRPIGANVVGFYSAFSKSAYKSEPKTVRDLIYPDVVKLLEKKSKFPSTEQGILTTLKNEETEVEYRQKITSNSKRSKYVTTFLKSIGKSESDKLYAVSHISELDAFISQHINSLFSKLATKYPYGIEEYKLIKHYGESDLEFKERAINNEATIQRLDAAKRKYNELKRKYPKGLPAFEQFNSYDDGKNSAELTLEEIVQCEEEIALFERNAEAHSSFLKWQSEQRDFASISRNLCLQNFGCYFYDVPLNGIKADGTETSAEYRVWQHFFTSFYNVLPETTISEDFKYLSDRASENSKFLTGGWNYKDSVYDEILELVKNFKEKVGDISIVFASNGLSPDDSFIFNHRKFEYLISKLDEADITYYEGEADILQQEEISLTKHIIIFEFISTNARLKQTVETIRKQFVSLQPLITYISLRKGYDFLEIEKLEADKEKERKRKQAEEEAEKKRLQQERERKAREEEAKRQELLRRQQEVEQTKRLFRSKVSGWHTLGVNFHFSYLLKYFPTTCEFEATESEWEDRWTVWNFKNTPGKTSPRDHREALDYVIPKLKSLLLNTFGSELLHSITLVCIPASSATKTQARYETFATRICSETGMINAYNSMHVISSSAEKKFGGSGITTNNVSFDRDFFQDKYVLLFDDVITKGDSMLRFKRKMEELGAIVIGGVSIGRTTHTR